MRWVYIGAGMLALSASCYMAVMASGGIQSPSAPGLIAMAVVLGVGAAAIGTALAGGHRGIAIVIGLGMLAGEGGAMLQTAQRVTAAREAMRAPIAAQILRREAALEDLAKAETAKPAPVDHARVDAAQRAKFEAEKAVREKSAEVGCRKECAKLLQSAVDAAQREVEAARADVARQEADQSAAIGKRLEIAKAAVAALPPPQSATPLADYTGVPEWLFDVIEALTLSFAINLPASTLVALGVKMGRPPRREADATPASAIVLEEVPSKAERELERMLPSPRSVKLRSPDAEAEKFGVAMIRPAERTRLSPSDIRGAYIGWCAEIGIEPLPMNEIAPALGKLFRSAGIEIENGYAIGVAIRNG
jgi:hypothetical protein